MFIGHLPTGYIVSNYSLAWFKKCGVTPVYFLAAGIFGALAPDLDLIYFYLIDHRQHHHHSYWSHYPIVWLSIVFASIIWFKVSKIKHRPALLGIFATNGFIHMILDTIVGDIWWLAPFVDKPFVFFTVVNLYKPWWLNFILHWTFILELAICLWAFVLWRNRRKPAEEPCG